MNYIYDILINLNKKLYDFYEWNLNDNIMHIRKIPLIKISSDNLLKIKNKQIKLNESFLVKINNRTEVFTNKNVKILKYVCILSDGNMAIVTECDNDGKIIKMSKMLIDEEMEVIEVCEHIDEIDISYNLCSKKENGNFDFKTRKEEEMYMYILSQLNKNNYDKIKYLYYDCFDKNEEDLSKIILNIKNEIEKNLHEMIPKIYHFFKLTSIQK